MEHESFEDPADRRADERALRLRQGRPRGAARRRRDLHGGLPGDDRPRRLAAERVPHAGRRRRSSPAPTSRPSRARACRAGGWCCSAVADAWRDRREQVREQGDRDRAAHWARSARVEPSSRSRSRERVLSEAIDASRRRTTRATAAGAARPSSRRARRSSSCSPRGEREMTLATLRAMAAGRDLRPGRRRLLPLRGRRDLDRAALREDAVRQRAARARVPARLAGHAARSGCAEVCCETLDWALREMRGPEGGFCSALDADSEGVEGKFYVWTRRELREALGRAGRRRRSRTSARPRRQLRARHATCWRRAAPPGAARRDPRSACYEAASERVRPGLDDKRLTAWNALMVSALAEAGAALERERLRRGGGACAEFLLAELRDADGRLLRTWKDGRGKDRTATSTITPTCCEALLTLYETTFEPRWYREAVALARPDHRALRRPRARRLLHHRRRPASRWSTRRKDLEDSPIPSGNSAAAFGLLRLARCPARANTSGTRSACCGSFTRWRSAHPFAFGHLLAGRGLLPRAR